MAPGPKKKNFKKATHETLQDKKNVKVNVDTNKSSPAQEKYVEPSDVEFQKGGKSSLNSNWDRYEEPKLDPLADKLKGDDFDVLLSYSGGSSSHLQLQDEKYWDEGSMNENNLELNFEDLEAALKCIPFHKLMHLPENIFDESQVTKFSSCAAKEAFAYKNKAHPAFKKVVELPKTEIDMNILENTEESDTEEAPSKNYGIEENTENIIDSLTSSLSLKSWAKENLNDTSAENIENPPTQSDDLDFLLSLSVPSNKSVSSAPICQTKVTEVPKTTSVDDWLSSILDD